MIPPAIVDVLVREEGKKGFRLWLPLFLLWPLMLVVILIAIMVSTLVDVLLYVVGRPYHHYTLLLIRIGEIISRVRGTRVNVDGETTIRIVII